MRFATAVAAAGLAAGAVAQNATVSDVYVTEIVTAFTTFCPEATMITHGGSTYTVSEATTLTITNCPCTVTKPAYSSVDTTCSTGSTPAAPVSSSLLSSSEAAPVFGSSSEAAPVASSSSEAAPVTGSSSIVAPVPYSSAPASTSVVAPVPYSSSAVATSVAPYATAGNGTSPVVGSGTAPPSSYATTSSSATSSATVSPYTGAANKAYSAAGAGVLALFGLVAAL